MSVKLLFHTSLKERTDGTFAKSPFEKGERSNFSLFERKVTKEANNLAD